MAWDHLSINRPHLVYIILGGFTSLFMLCSSFIKERLYIGEATVATICGVIFGPHAANLINPGTWGNTDQITLEFSRIVLVVQCFAVGVELPKYYMEKHWRSVVFLLIPVMTFGWLITSLFIWWMVPPLDWLQALCCAACVTATDPVLASSVVGKGKFAKRVPKHLRDILSAESGCNDGMAFPFIYLALYLIDYRPDADKVAQEWIVITILYECVFGAIYGFLIGYIGRHGIKFAEKHDLVDRESFLVFYFVLALFCAGSGSILGVDDLLVGFAAGVGFSNDGWFTQKTEESHVSNVIDLLLNLAYFVYLGTIIPWEQYNNPAIGLTPWRLVVIAIFVILFRRIPIMMALKPIIPDVKTWREALFAGHFGPIGVGAIFVAILARAELETEGTTPLASYPPEGEPNSLLVALIWPITTFLVISSIIVHGSSIAVFTLGKHINTLTLTMSYTTGNPTDDGNGPSWLNRLPRITSVSKSQGKSIGSDSADEGLRLEDFPPGELPPIGIAGHFLRRQKEEDNPSRQGSRTSSLIPRRRKKKWDDGLGPGGPISQSAIYPQRRSQSEHQSEYTPDTLTPGEGSPENEKEGSDELRHSDSTQREGEDLEHTRTFQGHEKDDEDERNEDQLGEVQHDPEMEEILHRDSNEEQRDRHISDAERNPEARNMYMEGDDVIIEDADGEVIEKIPTRTKKEREEAMRKMGQEVMDDIEHPSTTYRNLRKKLGVWRHKDELDLKGNEKKPKKSKEAHHKRGPALAYQFGNTIIVEDTDGEVVKTYELPKKADPKQNETTKEGGIQQSLKKYTGVGGKQEPQAESSKVNASSNTEKPARAPLNRLGSLGQWGFAGKGTETAPNEDEEEDDRRIRFRMGGSGRRLTKDDFLKEIQDLDPKARCEIIEESDAPPEMKALAKKDASKDNPGSNRLLQAQAPQMATGKEIAAAVGAEMAKRRGADVGDEHDTQKDNERGRKGRTQGIVDLVTGKKDKAAEKQESSVGPAEAMRRQSSKPGSPSTDEPETAAEKKRREKAMRGVDDLTDAQRGRSRSRSRSRPHSRSRALRGNETRPRNSTDIETAAERRRREAALGLSGSSGDGVQEEDSDDDGGPRVPPPAAQRSRGIRFAQSPIRGKK